MVNGRRVKPGCWKCAAQRRNTGSASTVLYFHSGTRIYIRDGGLAVACRPHASCGTQEALTAQALALPDASSSGASSPSSGPPSPSLSVASGAADMTAEAAEPSPAEKVKAGTSPSTRSLYA